MIHQTVISPAIDFIKNSTVNATKPISKIATDTTNLVKNISPEKSLDDLKTNFNNAKSEVLNKIGKSLPSLSNILDDIDSLSSKSIDLGNEKIKDSFEFLMQEMMPKNNTNV